MLEWVPRVSSWAARPLHVPDSRRECLPACACVPALHGALHLQVECCIRSLSQGVRATHIIDGRQPHSLLMELLTDEGVGTMITG